MNSKSPKRREESASLMITRGVLKSPTVDRMGDGRILAQQCLRQLRSGSEVPVGDELDHQLRFPPQLFILLATTAFQPFQELLEGIRGEVNTLDTQVPLVGCSVAAIVTDEEPLSQGAALICIASRFIRATVGAAPAPAISQQNGIDNLLQQIGIVGEGGAGNGSKLLLSFMPAGVGVAAPTELDSSTCLPALPEARGSTGPPAGMVMSDGVGVRDSWVFANEVADQIVAAVASLESSLRLDMAASGIAAQELSAAQIVPASRSARKTSDNTHDRHPVGGLPGYVLRLRVQWSEPTVR